jgi:hypothetical protein
MTTVTFFLCPRLAGYTRVQGATKFSLNPTLKGGISLTKDVRLNVRFRSPNIVCLYNRQSQQNGNFTCVLQLKAKSLTFKNRASYILDGRTATLQMLHFIYIFQQM